MTHKNKWLSELSLFTLAVSFLLYTINIAFSQTASSIAEEALEATVSLEMLDRNGSPLGEGSGFFVDQNRVVTNFHVIKGAAKGTAKLVGKHTHYTIEGVIAIDKENDLALLKVSAGGVKPLHLGDSDAVRIGETVYVAGSPKGLEGTLSNGIISSIRGGRAKKRLQMTAPISRGSSGGPVLNEKGEVIGISYMTVGGGQNLNFAIPSNYLKPLLVQSGTVKPLSQVSRGNRSVSAKAYYKIDTAHSMIIFRAKHNGVSYNYGRFNEFTGEITMDEDVSKSTVAFEVKTASVDTANKKRDQHLRSSDFFSAKQFPVITFKSTKVSMKEGEEGMLEVTGDLELLGVKKSIAVDVEITGKEKGKGGESLIGFESVFTVNRSEFGMTYGAGVVSDDIRLTVSIEAKHE